jgi:hypothetical protein
MAPETEALLKELDVRVGSAAQPVRNLSTFVMISQNRADAKRQVIADQQWKTVQEEEQQSTELLDLSRQILDLTKEVRSWTATHSR